MTATGAHPPSSESVRRLLAELCHAGARFSVHDMPGSFSNFTHLIKFEQDDSPARKIVMRRYNPANYEEDHNKPLCEYHALQMLQSHGIPAPPPLLLDASGELLGLPGVVTEYVPGKPIELPASAPPMMDPDDWFAHPYMAAGFRRFIAEAKQRLLEGN